MREINFKPPFAVIGKVMWAHWKWKRSYGCSHVTDVSGSGQETLSILGPSYVSVTSLPARLKVRVPLGWSYYHSQRQEGPLRPFTPHIRTQDGRHKLLEITFPPHCDGSSSRYNLLSKQDCKQSDMLWLPQQSLPDLLTDILCQ